MKNSKSILANQSGGSAVGVIIILIMLGGALFFTASYHIVKTAAGIKIYPKRTLSLKDPYVDMTSMSFLQLRNHQELVSAMMIKGDLKYVPGGSAMIKAAQAGRQISEAVTKFDSEYQVSSSAKEIGRIGKEKYNELDARHDISGKMNTARNVIKDKAKKFNKWLKNR